MYFLLDLGDWELPSLQLIIYADCDFEASLRVTSLLRDLLCSQDHVDSFAALDGQMSARAGIHQERRQASHIGSRQPQRRPNLNSPEGNEFSQ